VAADAPFGQRRQSLLLAGASAEAERDAAKAAENEREPLETASNHHHTPGPREGGA
jgi:hypothetical protein